MTQQGQIQVNQIYTIQEGDTLSSIAQHAYNKVSRPYQMAIYSMNQRAIGGDHSVIQPGMSLWIPIIADPPQTNIVYIVQAGDTLTSIAQQTYNNGSELYSTALYKMNRHTINDPNIIKAEDPLYLPPISNPSPIVNTFYIRQRGDTLSSIAQQAYQNPKESTLISRSELSEKGIKAGTILFIPFSQQVPGGGNIHPPDNWP